MCVCVCHAYVAIQWREIDAFIAVPSLCDAHKVYVFDANDVPCVPQGLDQLASFLPAWTQVNECVCVHPAQREYQKLTSVHQTDESFR